MATPWRSCFKTSTASSQVLHNATRNAILTAMNEYRRTLPQTSNLLIYYAGHGHHDPDTDKAYWLPVDAQSDNNDNWVSADDITADVKALPSLHVLIISDSCYSGVLTRSGDTAINPRERSAYIAKMMSSKSRNLMSSGADEPVADGGTAGHSVFAGALLASLHQMDPLRRSGRTSHVPRFTFTSAVPIQAVPRVAFSRPRPARRSLFWHTSRARKTSGRFRPAVPLPFGRRTPYPSAPMRLRRVFTRCNLEKK